jgi:hypothetical protein
MILAIDTLLLAFTLRGVNVGDSCRHAADVEVASGAHPALDIERMLAGDLLAFDDTVTAGEQELIMYSCTHDAGTVSSITISSEAGSASQALHLYNDKKAALKATLGAPEFDTDNLSKAQRARVSDLTAGLFLNGSVTSWKLQDHLILQLLIAKHPHGETWDVKTSISPSLAVEPSVDRKEPPKS